MNIEREVELGEETHSKGVLIMSGYLSGRYAHEVPLSLSATLCFEQSYDEVAGDSALGGRIGGIAVGVVRDAHRPGHCPPGLGEPAG